MIPRRRVVVEAESTVSGPLCATDVSPMSEFRKVHVTHALVVGEVRPLHLGCSERSLT